MLIVLSYRDEVVDPTHPLRVVLGELATGLAVARVRLGPLSVEGVAQLAEPSGVDPDRLRRVTGGNPFFVTEVLASGDRDSGHGPRRRPRTGGAVDAAARRLLDAVSIVTPQAELWLLEACR